MLAKAPAPAKAGFRKTIPANRCLGEDNTWQPCHPKILEGLSITRTYVNLKGYWDGTLMGAVFCLS
jgi:hypothetical protein